MTVLTETVRTFELGPWDLSELLPEAGEATFVARLAEIESLAAEFEKRRGDLSPTIHPDRLIEILRQYETLIERLNVVGGYASLRFYADTLSQQALAFRNRVHQLGTAVDNRTLFFPLWWRGLSDEEVAALLPRAAEHADYKHFLEDMRRLKSYTLEEKSEQIINLKDTNGVDAVLTLYSMLTNRLEFTLEVDGEVKKLTRDELTSFSFSPRPEQREAAYRELYRVFEPESGVLGQIYMCQARNWADEMLGLRGYASPISVRNVSNDIPDRAVEVLLDTARQNAPVFQRYFRLKAQWLGLERLRRYDLYAPLASSEEKIAYPDAIRSVLETFNAFHPSFAELAERVLSQRHLDGETRRGKRNGAFCYTVTPRLTPWVLVNYSGRVRDVATLAHELGHAVHSMLANHHSGLTQHASLPLAETASVFGEMLMTDRLLREQPDPLARRELLASSVDDVYATVMRQAYFVLFEIEAHEAIRRGCTIDDISDLYLGKLHEQFGDSVIIPPEFRNEWLGIPHIYQTPFYCYAYSFGQLLVLALYRRYQEQGEAFKPGYLRLLSYGGSARPQDILTETGIDITDRAFWQGGFDLVSERIDELERL